MHLNGWIGLKKKARERHVFTLPAINQHCRLESGEQKTLSFAACAARALWRLGTTPGKDLPEISEIAIGTSPDPLGRSLPWCQQSQNLATIAVLQALGVLLCTNYPTFARTLHEKSSGLEASDSSI